MANLTLERLARAVRPATIAATWRRTAAGWRGARSSMRGLKRGFTYYRHHPGAAFADRGLDSERLLVAASPDDAIADTHWLRADVDHHFVREAVASGVDVRRPRWSSIGASFDAGGARLEGNAPGGARLDVRARFVVDASGPGGFLARQLGDSVGARAD